MTATTPAQPSHHTPTRSERIDWATAAIFVTIAAFQLALAVGAPWGRAAWGGSNHGVLPAGLRIASVGSAAVNLTLAGVATGRLARHHRRGATIGLIVYSAAGLISNLATRSPIERAIWAPVTAVLLVCSVVMLRRLPQSHDRTIGRTGVDGV